MNRSRLKKLKGIGIIVLVPVFFTVLFGLAFSKAYVQDIPIAVLDLDGSSASRMVADMLEDSEGLRIAYYVSSLPEMEEQLKRGEIHGGLVLPSGFGKDLRSSQSPNALVLINFSNIVIGNNLLAYASNMLNTLNAGLSLSILEAGQIVPYVAEQSITTLTFVERMLYDPRLAYFTYMYAIFLAVFIQQTYLSVIVPSLVEEKMRGRGKIAIGHTVKGILVFAFFSFVGAFASLTVAHEIFHYPVQGNLLELVLLQGLFLVNLTAMAVFLAAFFEDQAHCGQYIVMLSVPTVLISGYVWPEFMVEPWFSALTRGFWPMVYFINPLRDICVKGVGLAEIGGYLRGGGIFALGWSIAAVLAFRWRAKRLRRTPSDAP